MLDRWTLRPLVTLTVAGLLGAACGASRSALAAGGAATLAPPTTGQQRPAPTVIHVQSDAGITTVDSHGVGWNAPGAVATPDWATIFNVDSGRLRTLDGHSGTERASQPVAAGLRAVVSSADGRVVALTDNPGRVGQGVLPAGRSRSQLVVAPADRTQGPMRTISVDGNVVPEAFSSDHSQLYVIEFLPPTHPDRYRVRNLDIASGQLGPVYTFDKTVDTEEMQGLSRTQVFSANGPYGAMLYTLYSRANAGAGYDAVHALSLDGGLVHCTDLPAGFGIATDGGAIAVSPDGQHVYVASASGDIAEIDTSASTQQPFPIVRTTNLKPGGTTPTVALTADNHTLWVGLGTQLTSLTSSGMQPVTTTNLDQPIYALAVRADTMYAATSTTVEAIAPSSGASQIVATIDAKPARLALG